MTPALNYSQTQTLNPMERIKTEWIESALKTLSESDSSPKWLPTPAPKPTPLMQRVSETRKRYGDAQTFLKLLNPAVQTLAVRHPDRAYMGTAPTLAVVRAAYTEEVAELWLMAQVENMNDFCGVSRKMTLPQMQELARMMLAEVPYLKTSELLLFFHRFKAGHYGEFFGVVDPQRVLSGLQAFLSDRRSEMDRYQREEAARLRDADRTDPSARAVTYAEYCQLKAAEAIRRQAEAQTA